VDRDPHVTAADTGRPPDADADPGGGGDPAAMRRAELLIAACLLVAIAAPVALTVVYVSGGQPQLEGALLAAGLGAVGIALVVWANALFGLREVVEPRPAPRSDDAERAAFVESFVQGGRTFSRRRTLLGLLAAAGAAFAGALVVPLRSLGPSPGRALLETAWRPGSRLVTEDGERVRVDDLEVGGVLTVFPEGAPTAEDSATLLIRVDPAELDLPDDRRDWVVEGNVAYSKICTHVGCPVGLYNETTKQLLCPCHQSLFDVLRGARPIGGPATRPLPQLPLGIGDDGELVALGDFPEPIGPGFWDRDR
jgi:ubiquinol-cytochrome c reductase iron-sulfur subunit